MAAMQTNPTPPTAPALARTMGLWALVIYGVGDMLGSGIYALIGKAAGIMGYAVWIAFAASMVAAMLTGLSYASLGSRYPRAAGAAYITHRAFHWPFLSYLIGLAIMASGLTSMATQSRAFTGYLTGMLPSVPGIIVIVGFIGVLTFINFWGMRESTWLNIICTMVELGGLLMIIAIGLRFWGSVNYLQPPPATQASGGLTSLLVLQGAVLTFYSFIGFEDMINVSEEVKNPRRNFPLAVIIALIVTAIVYFAVSISAVSVVAPAELAASKEPLVEVVRRAAPWFPTALFSIIALFAITNTALLNYIMGSRLAYGMARQGFLPALLGRVHPQRRTPHVAIVVLMCLVLILVSAGDLAALASATSVLLLASFIIINAALIILKRRPDEPKGAFEVPAFVPAGGILVCAALLTQASGRALVIAVVLLVAIALLYLLTGPKRITEETLADLES